MRRMAAVPVGLRRCDRDRERGPPYAGGHDEGNQNASESAVHILSSGDLALKVLQASLACFAT